MQVKGISKSTLVESKTPCSSTGKEESQDKALFSLEREILYFKYSHPLFCLALGSNNFRLSQMLSIYDMRAKRKFLLKNQCHKGGGNLL